MTNLVKKATELKALAVKKGRPGRDFTDDEINLALAWVDGILGTKDIQRVLVEQNQVTLSPYPFLARALKQYLNSLPKQ